MILPLELFPLLTGLVEGSYCTMFGSGLVISWIYLRFYQLHANGSRGDTADSFSFASFFPNVMQPPINACFSILVRLRICKKRVRRYDIGGGSSSGGPAISISLPGVDNHDTERRRQIALKALKDRLSKTELSEKSDPSNNWPSLDDENVSSSSKANNSEIGNTLSKDAASELITATEVQIDIDNHAVAAGEDLELDVSGQDERNDDKRPLLSSPEN